MCTKYLMNAMTVLYFQETLWLKWMHLSFVLQCTRLQCVNTGSYALVFQYIYTCMWFLLVALWEIPVLLLELLLLLLDGLSQTQHYLGIFKPVSFLQTQLHDKHDFTMSDILHISRSSPVFMRIMIIILLLITLWLQLSKVQKCDLCTSLLNYWKIFMFVIQSFLTSSKRMFVFQPLT